jgi:hypothetical protein
MKSVKQQYIDLKEGKMTQAQFMRNVRMSLPQYVTNVTSFNDTVKILKNKAILTEADIKENIHNTAHMGGIFSNKQAEDKDALEEIKSLIENGLSPEEAINQVAKKHNYYPVYLTKIYNQHTGMNETDIYGIAGDPEAEAERRNAGADIKPKELSLKIKDILSKIGDI